MVAKNAFLLLTLIICLASVCGCTVKDEGSGDSPATGKYVAVQEDLLTSGRIIEGSYTLPPHITLPPLPFNYYGSATNGSDWASGSSWENGFPGLNDGYYPAINESLKVLLGTIYYRDVTPYDTRTGMRVRGVYSLPYAFESGLVLRDIDRNGTLYGSYNNTTIVLRSGEQWTSPAFSETKSGSGTGLDQKPFAYTANFSSTWKITNLGVFDKSNLTRYNNNASAIGYNAVFAGADPAEK